MKNKATVHIDFAKSKPRKNGTCAVSLRIKIDGKKKFYPFDIHLTEPEFNKIMHSNRRTKEQKDTYDKICSFEQKAIKAIQDLPIATFSLFEDAFFENRGAVDTIKQAFENRIKELEKNDQEGTAETYRNAISSLEKFQKGMKFIDIDKKKLEKYEEWMRAGDLTAKPKRRKCGSATIGIYLRPLRELFNSKDVHPSIYPFGAKKYLYSIPTSRNVKKALTFEDIVKINHYKAKEGSMEQRSRDYWIFSFLCNGMNFKDMLLLKWKDIDGDDLTFVREKTKRSKKTKEPVQVVFQEQAKIIIKRWGSSFPAPDAYIFPHIKKDMTAKEIKKMVALVVSTTNKYMKLIAKELEINKKCTTYYARHSFSQVLRESGESIEIIGEALGHADIKTTMSYLSAFSRESRREATAILAQIGTN